MNRLIDKFEHLKQHDTNVVGEIHKDCETIRITSKTSTYYPSIWIIVADNINAYFWNDLSDNGNVREYLLQEKEELYLDVIKFLKLDI